MKLVCNKFEDEEILDDCKLDLYMNWVRWGYKSTLLHESMITWHGTLFVSLSQIQSSLMSSLFSRLHLHFHCSLPDFLDLEILKAYNSHYSIAEREAGYKVDHSDHDHSDKKVEEEATAYRVLALMGEARSALGQVQTDSNSWTVLFLIISFAGAILLITTR